ncbi:GntR family transcriptional regulator [Pendulispora rubella]|uniref:GntR family transcriptional regulator n=1 Tax=Pendulispora rubella TaxID=2741070 RepID=A0ABZ2LCP9_9BACT
MVASFSEPTLATTLVDRVRADILAGALRPGEKLRLEHLAARYDVGRSPLREACGRLAAEGLVVIEDQRGFRVAPVSRKDLLDLTRTRQQIEALALRDSLAQGDLDWEARVTGALHKLERTPILVPGEPEALSPAWESAHRALHEALVDACTSTWLHRFRAVLYDQSERYRRLTVEYKRPDVRDVVAEHAALARAALSRDVERTCALMVEHVARTTDLVLEAYPTLEAET